MIPYIKHIYKVLQHKWFVLLIGLKIKVPLWRLIKHDISKLYPSEIYGYVQKFYYNSDCGFTLAWLHHQNHNDHHWEYWVIRNKMANDNEKCTALEMPYDAIKEMFADWAAASRAYEGFWPDYANWEWFNKHNDQMNITPHTMGVILHEIDKLYYSDKYRC